MFSRSRCIHVSETSHHRCLRGLFLLNLSETYFLVVDGYVNRVTVTQDASTSASNHVDKGTDSYLELVLISLKDHIVSLENQLRGKQYIIEELLKKAIKTLITAPLPIVT